MMTTQTPLDIVNVWSYNLEAELDNIYSYIRLLPNVVFSVNSPGLILRPLGDFRSREDFHYQTMRCNVEVTKVIQLQLTIADDESLAHGGFPLWVFNFHFDQQNDAYPDGLLQTKSVQYREKLKTYGINPVVFAESLFTSGLLLNERLRWIGFNCLYDFGYLLRMVSNKPLPPTEDEFIEQLQSYFPLFYDTRLLVQVSPLKTELQREVEELVKLRHTLQYEANSKTMWLFSRVCKSVDEASCRNILFGLTHSMRLISQH